MAKKKDMATDGGNPAEIASGIMRRMNLGEIWLCTDGEWFTTAELAAAHVGGKPELKLTRFKNR